MLNSPVPPPLPALKRSLDLLSLPLTRVHKRPRTFWDTVLDPDNTPAAAPVSPCTPSKLPVIPPLPSSSTHLPDFTNIVSSPVSNFTDVSTLALPSTGNPTVPTPTSTHPGRGLVLPTAAPSKPHTCGTCGSSFARSSHLRLHIRTIHEKLKPFQCEQCPAAFGHVSSKYRHFRTVHLKRRDFACDRCGQTFAERSAVLKHCRTVHEGSRPYPCPTCGFRFHFKLHLSQHISTVHEKQRPHHCSICNACFGQRSSLNRHSRQIHGVSTSK